MPIKVANIRLELDESEERLAGEDREQGWDFLATRSCNWRILRKSLDARGHDDIHFSYAAVVDLPEPDLARVGASSRAPDLCSGPLRLAGAGLEPARAPARHRRRGPGRPLRRLSARARRLSALDPGTRPGRQGPGRRRPPLRSSRVRSIPRATTSSAREAPAPSATASSPRAAPAPT